mgnify:CR=1 FL=1
MEWVYILFSKLELNTKIHSNFRKMFVKYTLIQFHFRMVKLYLCPFSTLIKEEILRNVHYLTPAKQLLVGRCLNYHARFFFISVSETSYKTGHTKFTQTPILYKNMSRDIIHDRWKVSILLHFRGKFNTNLSIKSHCEIPVNIT